jgi:hypothetical protein
VGIRLLAHRSIPKVSSALAAQVARIFGPPAPAVASQLAAAPLATGSRFAGDAARPAVDRISVSWSLRSGQRRGQLLRDGSVRTVTYAPVQREKRRDYLYLYRGPRE